MIVSLNNMMVKPFFRKPLYASDAATSPIKDKQLNGSRYCPGTVDPTDWPLNSNIGDTHESTLIQTEVNVCVVTGCPRKNSFKAVKQQRKK